MRTSLLLVSFSFVLTSGACSSSSSPGESGATDAGTSDAPLSNDGSTQSAGPLCEGKDKNGILGSWGITLLAGGDAPGGSTTISVKGTYRFCGTSSTGTFRYTEDGLHTPGRGCEHVSDRSGSFTYDNTTLTLTTERGFLATRKCSDSSQNYEQQATVPSTQSYPTAVFGNELTIQDGSVSGGKPGSVYTRE